MPGDTDDAPRLTTPNCRRGHHGDSKRKETEAPPPRKPAHSAIREAETTPPLAELQSPATASSVLQLRVSFTWAAVSYKGRELTSSPKSVRA